MTIQYKTEHGQVETPKKTYFWVRESGEVFATEEQEAYHIQYVLVEKMGRKLQLYGVSDGKLYNQAVKEAIKIKEEQGLAEAQKYLRGAFEKEKAVAKGNLEKPPDLSTMESNGGRLI